MNRGRQLLCAGVLLVGVLVVASPAAAEEALSSEQVSQLVALFEEANAKLVAIQGERRLEIMSPEAWESVVRSGEATTFTLVDTKTGGSQEVDTVDGPDMMGLGSGIWSVACKLLGEEEGCAIFFGDGEGSEGPGDAGGEGSGDSGGDAGDDG